MAWNAKVKKILRLVSAAAAARIQMMILERNVRGAANITFVGRIGCRRVGAFD